MKLLHIVTGWSKSLGLLEVPADQRQCSEERMRACACCPHAKESSFLKLMKGKGHHMAAIYCSLCTCPVNEKSLVPGQYCPLGKWPGDQENKDFITNNKKQPK